MKKQIEDFNNWIRKQGVIPVGRVDKLNLFHIESFLNEKGLPSNETACQGLMQRVYKAWLSKFKG